MPVGRFAVDCVEGGVESKVASEEDLGNTNMVANSLGWAKLFDKQANKKATHEQQGPELDLSAIPDFNAKRQFPG